MTHLTLICHFCITCAFLLASTHSHAEEISYKVTYVYDGDTVKLHPINANDAKKDFRFRLADVDAPERNQDYGLQSRRALIKLCQGKNTFVTAVISGTDQYSRSLGRLQCNHIDASTYLIEHGLAWHYARYSSDAEIANTALNARQKNIGLWADDYQIPPWKWRREHAQHIIHKK